MHSAHAHCPLSATPIAVAAPSLPRVAEVGLQGSLSCPTAEELRPSFMYLTSATTCTHPDAPQLSLQVPMADFSQRGGVAKVHPDASDSIPLPLCALQAPVAEIGWVGGFRLPIWPLQLQEL